LLATVSIIVILAGIVLGGMSMTRESAKLAKTKATIAKLDNIITRRYESYLTRRVPIDVRDADLDGVVSAAEAATPVTPVQAAARRYRAVYDLMRFELPDRATDVANSQTSPTGMATRAAIPASPALAYRYYYDLYQSMQTGWNQSDAAKQANFRTIDYLPAELLYEIVRAGTAEDLQYFDEREIGDIDNDGSPEFHDAWGQPIMFLRWAPAFSPNSGIQSGNPTTDHDPYDTLSLDATAFRLTPLIYSAGPDKKYGIETGTYNPPGSGASDGDATDYDGSPFSFYNSSFPMAGLASGTDHVDNINNHLIEAR
jgi:hypothetical protein